jgi:DNA polymerase III alpha subunit
VQQFPFSRCKELGMDSVAITDHGNMFGGVDFYTQAAGSSPFWASRSISPLQAALKSKRAALKTTPIIYTGLD